MPVPAPIRAKLDWADQHLKVLSDEAVAYGQRQPYRYVKSRTDDRRQHFIGLAFDEPIPSERWGLLLADAVQNLRSALDHLVFAVAVKEAGGSLFPPGEKEIMFPVAKPGGWDSVKWRVKTLSENVRAAIEREQSGLDHTLLFVLDRINAVSKHRSLHVVATIPKDVYYAARGSGAGNRVQVLLRHGPLEADAPFLSFVTEHPAPEMEVLDVRFRLEVNVEILDPKNPGGRGYFPMDHVKDECRDAVHRVIERIAEAGDLD